MNLIFAGQSARGRGVLANVAIFPEKTRMVLFIAGFALSLLGSLPPGLINLSVARTAMQRGLVAASLLAAGAAVAEYFQAISAVVFSEWFMAHPSNEAAFRWVGVPVFLTLGAYFLGWAKPPRSQPEREIRHGREFFKGLIISAFNLLAVPYWVFYCGWLRLEKWLESGWGDAAILSAGVAIGSFAAFALYAWLAKKLLERSVGLAVAANKVAGAILMILGGRLLWQVVF